MDAQNISTAANGMFLAFEGHRLPQMAQATLDSGWFEGRCTLDELKALFKERGLGANNAVNFLNYAKSKIE